METKNNKGARERTTIDARAGTLENGLDLKLLSGKKRLDSKDVNVERTTMTRETQHSRKRVAARKKKLEEKEIFIKCYQSSWFKERWREYIVGSRGASQLGGIF